MSHNCRPRKQSRVRAFDGSSRCLDGIPPASKVGVMGTQPSGIEVARMRQRAGHYGQTLVVSRSGRLPKVQSSSLDRSLSGDVERIYRDLSALSSTRELTLEDVAAAFKPLIQQVDPEFEFDSFETDREPIEELTDDIQAVVDGGPRYQRITAAIGDQAPKFWHLLPVEEKRRFCPYWSIWNRYRHPIPRQTAEELLTGMRAGQIKVGRIIAINTANPLKLVVALSAHAPAEELEVDYVIWATGPNFDVNTSPNPFVRQLIKSGLASPNEFGGIDVDFDTLRLRNQSRIWAIGALTRGVTFYVTSLPRLRDQAIQITEDLLSSLKTDAVGNNE